MAEFEELRLTVNLADTVSAGIQKLRGEVNLLGQSAKLAAEGMASASGSVVNFGNVASTTIPKVRSANAAMRDLQRSAMDTGRALGQMAVAVQLGTAGMPRLALGAWDAAGGMRGISTALQTIAPSARIAVLGIGGVALGITVVVAAFAIYNVAVFKFAREMEQLGRTARSMGMSFGDLKNATDQAKAYGHSADSVVRSFQGIQAAQLDLYKNNSQLRQRLLAQGVSNDWINQLATADPRAAREMIARYGKALERQALEAGVGANIAAGIRNQFYEEHGQNAADMELALKPIDPAKQAEMDRIEEQSIAVSKVWAEISFKLEKMTFSGLSAGLPVLLGTLRGINVLIGGISKMIGWVNSGLEKAGTSFKDLLKLVPGLGAAITALELLYKHGGGNDAPAKPGVKPQQLPLWKPTSYDAGNESNPLLIRASFTTTTDLVDQTDRNATETEKVTGQLEKLNAFFERMESGSGGGGSGASVVKASLTTGDYSGGGGSYGGASSGGGGGGGYGAGGTAGTVDMDGKGIDPETMKQVEAYGRAGDTAGLQKLFAAKGYRMNGPACGIVASKYVMSAGFKPPTGGAMASNWNDWGVKQGKEDINNPNRPFGSMIASYSERRYGGNIGAPLYKGQRGGHVMTIVPGTYNPKTNTAMFADQYGVRERSIKNMDLRYAGDDAVAEIRAKRSGDTARVEGTNTGATGPSQYAPAGPGGREQYPRMAEIKAAMKDQYVKQGVPEAQAEEAANAMVGQAIAESGLKSQYHDTGKRLGAAGGYHPSIYGADKTRGQNMVNWIKKQGGDPNDTTWQGRWMAVESLTYKRTKAAIMRGNRHEIADTATVEFEAPATRFSPQTQAERRRNADLAASIKLDRKAIAANSNPATPTTAATAQNRGAFLDRSAITGAQKPTVDGRLKAKVNGPAGTEVEVKGSGAFEKTETQRSTTVKEDETVSL